MDVRQQFQHHLDQHADQVGFKAPRPLMAYLTDLLASRLRRVDIIPEPSFAECYLALYRSRCWGDQREFADTTLFFVSLLPEYGQRRGLDMSYYATLGISAYYTYGDLVGDPRFTQLGNWFYYLQHFLNSALHPHTEVDFWRLASSDKY